MHTRSIVPFALAWQCGLALAQGPADFHREDATAHSAGETRFSNVTPHTGAQTQVFTQGDSSGRTTETVTFDSDPAP